MTDDQAPAPERGPNCWRCQYFAVSWDPRRPYACQRLGFKSPGLPALEVLRIDGQMCRGFLPKPVAETTPRPEATPGSGHAAPSPKPTATSTRHWLA